MSDQTPDDIDLEPSKAIPASDEGALPPPIPASPVPAVGAGARVTPPSASQVPKRELEPIDLEEPVHRLPRSPQVGTVPRSNASEPGPAGVKELDVCPNCGASMRGGETLICLRCGFDLKTMQVVKTQTGEVAVTAAAAGLGNAGDGGTDERPILVQEQSWDTWLPMAMAGVGALVLLIGYLSGMMGLFPVIERAALEAGVAPEAKLADRFLGLLRFITLSAMWTVCGVVALAFVSHLLGMRFVGNAAGLWTAFLRMLGIVVLMRVASMLNFPAPTLEWVVEAIIQGVVFLGLSMVLFRLKPRDLPTFGGSAVVLFLLLWVMSHAVVWVTG